jgi:two-component system phosphate regulon response regulator PhoB
MSIIMTSARAHEEDRVAALESGADDYMIKPLSTRELIARMKAVLRRRAPQLGDDVVEVSGLRFDPGARYVTVDGREIALRRIEFSLLHFLLTHPNRTFSRGQLLDQVWGAHVFVEERTVDVHVRRLRHALVPSRHDRLIETVRGIGYRFRSSAATTSAPARCATLTDLIRDRGSRALLPAQVRAA